jgi:hypothetical protein
MSCPTGPACRCRWRCRKGIDTSTKLGKHQWVIERTIAWHFGYRRLTTRYERKANHFSAFLTLAPHTDLLQESHQ